MPLPKDKYRSYIRNYIRSYRSDRDKLYSKLFDLLEENDIFSAIQKRDPEIAKFICERKRRSGKRRKKK